MSGGGNGRFQEFVVSGNSPAGAAQAIVDKPVGGLDGYDYFTVFADLIGAVGGTLDVYVQRKLEAGVWIDWIHFPQLAGGAAAVRYCCSSEMATGVAPVVVGKCGDLGTGGGDGVPALAANVIAPGHPGPTVRVVAVAGAGAAVAAVVVRILGQRSDW